MKIPSPTGRIRKRLVNMQAMPIAEARRCRCCEPCTLHADLHGIARQQYWGKVLRPVLPFDASHYVTGFQYRDPERDREANPLMSSDLYLRAGRAE